MTSEPSSTPSGTTAMVTERLASLLALGTLAALMLSASTASAHEMDPRHRVIASVSDAGAEGLRVEVLLVMELPRGRRAARLRARFDLDRDGAFNPLEAKALAGELGPEAVGGFVLLYNDKAQQPEALEQRAVTMGDDGLSIALLMTYKLRRVAGRLAVRVLKAPRSALRVSPKALMVELQALAPLKIARASAPVAADAPVAGPAHVHPGGADAWLEVALPDAPPAESPKREPAGSTP